MSNVVDHPTKIDLEALQWFEWMRHEPNQTEEQKNAFWAWVLQSEKHLHALLNELAVHDLLDAVRRDREKRAK